MITTDYTIYSEVDIDNNNSERIITQKSTNTIYFFGIKLWKTNSIINNSFTRNKISSAGEDSTVGFLKNKK